MWTRSIFFFFFLCMKISTMWDDNKRALFLCTVKEKKPHNVCMEPRTFSRSERGKENQAAGMQSSGKQRTCSQNFMVRRLHRDRDKFRSQPRKPVLPWQRLLLDHQDAILTKQPRLDVHPGERYVRDEFIHGDLVATAAVAGTWVRHFETRS